MVNDYFIAEDNQVYIYVDNAVYTHEKKNESYEYNSENVCEYLFDCTKRIVKDTRDFLNTYMCLYYSGDDVRTQCNRRLKNISKTHNRRTVDFICL